MSTRFLHIWLVAAALGTAGAAVADAGRIDVASSQPVNLDGETDVVLRSARFLLHDEEGSTTGTLVGVEGRLTIWTWRTANANAGPVSVSREVSDGATREDHDLSGATLTLGPNGGVLYVAGLGDAGGDVRVHGDAAGSGLPLKLSAPADDAVRAGTGGDPTGAERIDWRLERGWWAVGDDPAIGIDGAFPTWDAPRIAPAGAFLLQIDHGVLEVAQPGDPDRRFALGGTTEQGVDTLRTQVHRRAVFEGTVLDGDLPATERWSVGAAAWTWTVDGTVAWTGASGSGQYAGADVSFTDAAVSVVGAVAVEPDVGTVGVTLATPAWYTASGDWTSFTVDGATPAGVVAAKAATPVVAVSIGALFLALLTQAGQRLAMAPVVSLYTRLAPAALLDHERRRAIYAAVTENPGIHTRELHRKAGGAWGPFTFHLRLLQQGGYLRTEEQGKYTLVYPTASPAGRTVAIPHPVARSVYEALPADGGRVAFTELRTKLGLSRQLLSYHLRNLEARGLVALVPTPDRSYGVSRVVDSAAADGATAAA